MQVTVLAVDLSVDLAAACDAEAGPCRHVLRVVRERLEQDLVFCSNFQSVKNLQVGFLLKVLQNHVLLHQFFASKN